MTHRLHQSLIDRPVVVHLVGTGGNGSYMLSGLAKLNHALQHLGHPGFELTAWDPDTVSEANVGRQLFYPGDVGHAKSDVLVNRINAAFGVSWRSVATRYSTTGLAVPDVLVSCVDSAAARVEIGKIWDRGNFARYWLDLGNRAADGQVVLGSATALSWGTDAKRQPKCAALPTVLDLHPEIVAGEVPDDDAPSCSLAEALERQQLFINQHIANEACELLWRLFRFGEIDWHAVYVNLNPRSVARRATNIPLSPKRAAKRAGATINRPKKT